MKKVVAIIGTNAVGKTTLARNIMNHAGGADNYMDGVTYCKDKKTALIGDYTSGKKISGVDEFGETKFLAEKIKGVELELVVFEGVKCGTFGVSIQSALLAGTDSLVIFLYASANTINKRLIERSQRGIQTVNVLTQQKANLNAAVKYKGIGVPVISINTDNLTPADIFEQVKEKIF